MSFTTVTTAVPTPPVPTPPMTLRAVAENGLAPSLSGRPFTSQPPAPSSVAEDSGNQHLGGLGPDRAAQGHSVVARQVAVLWRLDGDLNAELKFEEDERRAGDSCAVANLGAQFVLATGQGHRFAKGGAARHRAARGEIRSVQLDRKGVREAIAPGHFDLGCRIPDDGEPRSYDGDPRPRDQGVGHHREREAQLGRVACPVAQGHRQRVATQRERRHGAARLLGADRAGGGHIARVHFDSE